MNRMSQSDQARETIERKEDDRPLTFKLANWWGFIFAAIFLIYGVVKVILSVLDRNYDAMATPIVFALIGALLLTVAYGFRDLKKWGWFGLIGVNSLVVILAVLDFSHVENLILLVISAGALYTLFAPQTKDYLAGHR